MIATHRHDDTMGGLNFMHQHRVSSYALELTRDIAKSENLPLPQHTFKDSLLLKLDDEPLICRYFGGGHTSDNIVVWIPGDKILFGGCLIRSAGANNLGNTTDADLNAWPETVKKLLAAYKDCKIVVPGHGGIGDFSLIEHTLELLESNKAQ